jgi:hypothetical protein
MPIERFDGLPEVITFPRDAIVEDVHVGAALHIGLDAVAALDLPCVGTDRRGGRKRYLWGQVLDVLAERALPTARPQEREAAKRSIQSVRRIG